MKTHACSCLPHMEEKWFIFYVATLEEIDYSVFRCVSQKRAVI